MSKMVTVFSQISAIISPEFSSAFPPQFLFSALLNKICEDTNVSVSTERSNFSFLLEGSLESLLNVQNMLLSSHALFGTNANNEGPPQSSRPFNALVEAAEAISRGVELQEHLPDENTQHFSTMTKEHKEHDYVSQLSDPQDQATTSQELHEIVVTNSGNPEGEVYSQLCDKDFIQASNESPSESMASQTENDEETSVDSCEIMLPYRTNVTEGNRNPPIFNVPVETQTYNETFVKTKATASVQTYSCDQCSYTSHVKYYLSEHILNTHNQMPVRCDVCDKVFGNKRYLKRHQLIHKETTSLTCELCGRHYKCQKAFKAHKKTHETDYRKEEFHCDEIGCDKSFSSNYNLETHKKSEHLGIKKNFLCQTCGKSFTTKNTMLQHLNIHTGKRPYVCDICQADFTYESALRDHKNTHDKTRVFTCDDPSCNKIFYQRSALKIHKAIHKTSKDFVCKECNRGFTQKQALQRHERAHKGLKPFKCRYCGRTFGDHSVIRRHIQYVHKVNKDIDKWREDVIEVKADESDLKQKSTDSNVELMNKPTTIIPTQIPTIIQTSKIHEQLDGVPIDPVVSHTTTMVPIHISQALAMNKAASTTLVTVPGTTPQYQYLMPAFETAFLVKSAPLINLQRSEDIDSTGQFEGQQVQQPLSQVKEPLQFFNENLDGTFSSVMDSSQKGKTMETYLRQNVEVEATEQSLEQLKPDGTLQDDSEARFPEHDIGVNAETLSQLYAYYSG